MAQVWWTVLKILGGFCLCQNQYTANKISLKDKKTSLQTIFKMAQGRQHISSFSHADVSETGS